MQRYLIDTNVLIWEMEGRRLSKDIRRIIEGDTTRYISAASLWEIAVKASLGKLHPLTAAWMDRLTDAGFLLLPIQFHHMERVQTLPFHHRDPFDRMLVAQALTEGLTLITGDQRLREYGVATVAA